MTVVQGDNLTLECAAHGLPAPQLSWEKYGGHVPYGRHSLLLGMICVIRSVLFRIVEQSSGRLFSVKLKNPSSARAVDHALRSP